MPEADAEYYAGEARSGRWLLVVACPAEAMAGVLAAFGKYGGSVRVPAQVRGGNETGG